MFSIYALGDPRTQQFYYIGMAKNVYKRFAQHLNDPHHNDQKNIWMQEIKAAGIAPTLAILETVKDESIVLDRERYWIEYYLALGAPLTNITHGYHPKSFATLASVDAAPDYISAHDAAQILSLKMGRPIKVDYISKMTRCKKYQIRVSRFHDRLMYHKADIEACIIGQKCMDKPKGIE